VTRRAIALSCKERILGPPNSTSTFIFKVIVAVGGKIMKENAMLVSFVVRFPPVQRCLQAPHPPVDSLRQFQGASLTLVCV
jgi:hypothetical protein